MKPKIAVGVVVDGACRHKAVKSEAVVGAGVGAAVAGVGGRRC